jgi:hypothetical protein
LADVICVARDAAPTMQPANEIIVVRPAAGPRSDPRFEAMIAQLRPGNVDPFDGRVNLGGSVTMALTNPMAERLGQALLATNRTVTIMEISLVSMTPEGSEYPSLLRFLESSALGNIMLYGNPGAATATPAADERTNRTLTTILLSMRRNAEVSFKLYLFCMALLPTVLRLASEFVSVMGIYNCTFINNECETTTTTTRPLVPVVASAIALDIFWCGDSLPNEACEMLAALANIMARPLQGLSCNCLVGLGCGLSVQLAQSILDLATRQKSPIELKICIDTIAWQAGSIEILTQHCSKIGRVIIHFRLPETDQGIVQRAQINLLECLQSSTVTGISFRRTPSPTNLSDNFLDANGQKKLKRIIARNLLMPHLLSGRYPLTDRSVCYLLPDALRVGAGHGHFYVLVAQWIAANAHRMRRQPSSPPPSEHADGSSRDDNDNEFGTDDARATKRRRLDK